MCGAGFVVSSLAAPVEMLLGGGDNVNRLRSRFLSRSPKIFQVLCSRISIDHRYFEGKKVSHEADEALRRFCTYSAIRLMVPHRDQGNFEPISGLNH